MCITKSEFHRKYLSINLNATKEQFHNLAKGKSVRLTHHQISGGKHHVYLTRTQVNRLKKGLENQRGASIKLSQVQIKHHTLHERIIRK